MYGGFSGVVSDVTAAGIAGGVGIGTFVAVDQIASRVAFLKKWPRATALGIGLVGAAGGIALHRTVHSGVGMGVAAGSLIYAGTKLLGAFVPQLALGAGATATAPPPAGEAPQPPAGLRALRAMAGRRAIGATTVDLVAQRPVPGISGGSGVDLKVVKPQTGVPFQGMSRRARASIA